MKTSTHTVAQEEVMALLDGELSRRREKLVSAHLEECAECSALVTQFRGVSSTLTAWRVQPVPEKLTDLVADFAAEIRSGVKSKGPSIFVRASFWSWKQRLFGLSAGALVLILLAVISIPRLLRSTSRRVMSQPLEISPYFAESGDRIVAESRSRGAEAINGRQFSSLATLSQPGAAADSNGSVHGLGDHVKDSFSGNGQLAADQQSKVTSGAMIARTVSLSVVVKDFPVSRLALDAILARHHGYPAQLDARTPENASRSLVASLRILAPELAGAIADLKTLGRVENESQSGEEVSEQHTDLAARLKNARETEKRFRTILEQRTGNVVEVIQVEEGIARVRGDIERMEAEQKALEQRVEFAAVNLQLTEEYKARLNPPAASVATRIHNGLVSGYDNAAETLLGIVLFFAACGPALVIWLLILGLPVLFVWRRYRRSLAAV
jgi:anti-sigma factor RsiW